MTNNANRTLIVLVCAAMIVLMALLIFITWSADTDAIDKVGDFAEYLDAHNDNAGKLIVTLSALIVVVLALLLIVVELAPEDEEKELRVKQAGATTIVPAAALRARIEEALVGLPDVTAAKAKVNSRDKGIATDLNLTLVPNANVSAVTQDATRVVNDTIQNDLGLPVAGVPNVRVAYGGPKQEPVASSVAQPPAEPAAAEPAPDAEAAPRASAPEPEPEPAPDMTPTAAPEAEATPDAPAPDEPAPSEPASSSPAWSDSAQSDSPPGDETPAPEAPSQPGAPSPPDDVSRDPWRNP
jgi:hypothetical protein